MDTFDNSPGCQAKQDLSPNHNNRQLSSKRRNVESSDSDGHNGNQSKRKSPIPSSSKDDSHFDPPLTHSTNDNQPDPESSNSMVHPKDSDDNNDNQDFTSHSKFSDVLGELGQEAKMIILQYSQTFSDSELYEQQGIQAVGDLSAHAKVLEERLQSQKEMLCNRLKIITKHLKNEF